MVNLREFLLNSNSLYRLYKYLCFTALFLCVCTNTPDHCSDGNTFDSSTQFCYAGEAIDKCGGEEYNYTTQECDNGKIREREDICAGGKYLLSGDSCNTDTLPVTFTVTFDTDGGIPETISPVTVDSGKTVGTDFPEDPTKTGYTFDGWYDEDTLYDSSTEITKEVTLTAKFEINSYTLKTAALPAEGGSISLDPDLESYNYGTEVTVTAVKAEGYTFAGWSGASTSIINTQIIITMDGDKEIAAAFEVIPVNYYQLDIKTDPLKGGNVSRDPDGASYAAGTEVTVTAEPAGGYTFVSWSGASNSKNPSVTVTINTNTALTANFEVKECAVNVSVVGDGAKVTSTLDFVVKYGQDSVVRFSLTNKDAVLDSIVVNGKQVVNPDLGVPGSALWNEPRSFKLDKISSDMDVKIYARIPLIVTFLYKGVTSIDEDKIAFCNSQMILAVNKRTSRNVVWEYEFSDLILEKEPMDFGGRIDSNLIRRDGEDCAEVYFVEYLPYDWEKTTGMFTEYTNTEWDFTSIVPTFKSVKMRFVDEIGQEVVLEWKVDSEFVDAGSSCYSSGKGLYAFLTNFFENYYN